MKILIRTFAVLLLFTIVYGNDLVGHLFEISEGDEENFDQLVADGDIDTIWGAINSDSVRIGIQMSYSMNMSIETVAAWNVTARYSRKIDGIRLRSVNNTGAVGDILDGGVGYTFATFKLVGHLHHFYFIVDAFENYTSSLIPDPTTPAPIPDIVFKEWGALNYASKVILPYHHYAVWSDAGNISRWNSTINSAKIIDGIRLTSINNTVATAEILGGGVGFHFLILNVTAIANFLDYSLTLFENGTYLETRERVYGTVNNITKLDEKRFQNYPQLGSNATGNATFSTSGTILGIRITYLNYTDGRYEITNGGINESSVGFDFRGPNPGEPYDFKIEIFGNSAISMKLTIILSLLSSILVALFK